MLGFYRVAAAVPQGAVGDVKRNVAAIVKLYKKAAASGAAAVVFPEMSLTAYSIGDLVFQTALLDAARAGALALAQATSGSATIAIAGLPLAVGDAIYNVAMVAQGGKIAGFVPKQLLPNYREFYEKRYFTSGADLPVRNIRFGEFEVPFGAGMLFDGGNGFLFALELCEDLWGVIPPSNHLALAGARVFFNLSAGTELAGKADYRRELVRQQSARLLGAYILAGAGVAESTTDAVFGGHALIAENGRLAAENVRFERHDSLIFADIDLERLIAARRSESSFNDSHRSAGEVFTTISLPLAAPGSSNLQYAFNPPLPLVPPKAVCQERCAEIFAIQVAGLAKRWEHTGAKKLVLGVSGGLDSTLALLVAAECCVKLRRDATDIMALTMPGFGTTGRTRGNAEKLAAALGIWLETADIRPASRQSFADLHHDPEQHDHTYENVQARARTQILMNLANKHHGLVVGTGDLSEIALGWSTYNGDHMSMYAVNCSIPKTLIRYMLEAVAVARGGDLAAVLRDIIATPVSPELLPPAADGGIEQKTEEILGPYELHDFFLYHFIKYGAAPKKLKYLALDAWRGVYDEVTVGRTLEIFLRRFFQQQFKRSCMPDGPKVGTIALSPRGDWRMPSDAVGWRE